MRTKLTPAGKLLLVLVIAAGAALAGSAGARATKPRSQAWHCVLVRPGDTLWGISRAIAPRADPRDTIGRIVHRNRLATTWIMPGDALWVPAPPRGSLPDGIECGTIP